MASLTLKNLSKVYDGNVQAVSDVNLQIEDGEFVVLVGPSGCGKSTLLNMIAGLEKITQGQLYIGDRLVNDLPPKQRDIAMVFQNYALYPHMTVYKNMAFSLKLQKLPKSEIDQRVQEAADILGIEPLLQRLPKQLSGGQRQRVAVGRAIVRKPSVFLFDEPLSNLDAKLRVQMRVEIKELHQRLKTTMIYVTHDQTEAMTMGDRIVVLKDGLIQQVAKPMDLYDEPANRFVASFIGTPPMNFFDGELQSEGGQLVFLQDQGLQMPVPERFWPYLKQRNNGHITLGIRPEGIGSVRAEQRSKAPRIQGRIKVMEPMGSESYLYLDTGRDTCISKVDGSDYAVGDNIDLAVLEEKMHFFDHQTQQLLDHREL